MPPRGRRLVAHQNMRRYAGPTGNVVRVEAYLSRPIPGALRPRIWRRARALPGSYGFRGVRAGHGNERFAVVGLTELTNATGAGAALLTRDLVDGGGTTYLFNVGQSALGFREYSTVTVAARVTVLAAGRVTFGPARVSAHQTTPEPPVEWMVREPPGPADYRAAVYVVVRLEAREQPVAIAFLHNIYKEESARATTMVQINQVAAAIRANRVCPAQHVFFGGDFNVESHDRPGRTPLYAYDATVARPLLFPGARLGGTTWNGRLYDYWLCDINPRAPGEARPPVASVSTATLDGPSGLMSDHAASILRLG